MVGGVVMACHLLRVSGRSPDTFTAPKSNYIGNLQKKSAFLYTCIYFLFLQAIIMWVRRQPLMNPQAEATSPHGLCVSAATVTERPSGEFDLQCDNPVHQINFDGNSLFVPVAD